MLWLLLLFLFKYDYALDESGVDASGETNQHVHYNDVSLLGSCDLVGVCNNLARLSIVAVARL